MRRFLLHDLARSRLPGTALPFIFESQVNFENLYNEL
jgi:hypothetical protein